MEQTSVDKALDILFLLHASDAPLGVTAIGRALEMPKSSAHRLLGTLVDRGLVERSTTGGYAPGMALVALGVGTLDREPLAAAARPVIEEQAESLGETLFVTTARAGGIVVIDKAEGSGVLRAAPRVGANVPVHASAVGRLQLAFDPDALAARPDLDDSDLEVFTATTPTDAASIARAVARARRRGWDANAGEWIAGLSVVAVPIHAGGALRGALAAAAASQSPAFADAETLAARLTHAAARIAARYEGGSTAAQGAVQ